VGPRPTDQKVARSNRARRATQSPCTPWVSCPRPLIHPEPSPVRSQWKPRRSSPVSRLQWPGILATSPRGRLVSPVEMPRGLPSVPPRNPPDLRGFPAPKDRRPNRPFPTSGEVPGGPRNPRRSPGFPRSERPRRSPVFPSRNRRGSDGFRLSFPGPRRPLRRCCVPGGRSRSGGGGQRRRGKPGHGASPARGMPDRRPGPPFPGPKPRVSPRFPGAGQPERPLRAGCGLPIPTGGFSPVRLNLWGSSWRLWRGSV
jgi:hypothetical protein